MGSTISHHAAPSTQQPVPCTPQTQPTQPGTSNFCMQPSYSIAGYSNPNQGYTFNNPNQSAYNQSSSSSSESYSSYTEGTIGTEGGGNYQEVQNSTSSGWIWLLLIIVIIIIILLVLKSRKHY